jgi:hypothetical protein
VHKRPAAAPVSHSIRPRYTVFFLWLWLSLIRIRIILLVLNLTIDKIYPAHI